MKTFAFATTLSLSVLCCGSPHADDGEIDGSFGQNGRHVVAFDLGATNWDQLSSLDLDADNRIYLTGSVETDNGLGIGIARLDADGKPDDSFGTVYYRNLAHQFFLPLDAAVQADGKLLVAGTSSFEFTNSDGSVCRFLTTGKIDLDFGDPATPGCRSIDIGVSDDARSILVQPDGKIVLAGATFDIDQGRFFPLVIRLEESGDPDDGFGTGGVQILKDGLETSTSILDIAVAPSGDLVALTFGTDNANADFRLLRLRGTDGTLNPKFDEDGIVDIAIGSGDDYPIALAMNSDGSFFAAGNASDGVVSCASIVKVLPTGALDDYFDGDGLYIDQDCGEFGTSSATVQKDGKIVILGNVADQTGFRTIRVLPQGGRDPTYSGDGLAYVDFPLYGEAQPARVIAQTNRLLVGGSVKGDGPGEFDFGIARLGTTDDSIFENDFELSLPDE